jgi:hypothetical protein
MTIHLAGTDLPEPLLKAFAALTDHAVVRPADVKFDPGSHTLTLLLRLAPLVPRRVLPGHKRLSPSGELYSFVARNVAACRVRAEATKAEQQHQLLFGIQLRPASLYLSSATENRGDTCFEVDATVSSLDVRLAPTVF